MEIDPYRYREFAVNWNPSPHDSPSPPALAGWRAVRARGVGQECFADEIAIDFPSVAPVVDRMRDAFFGDLERDIVLAADLQLTAEDAWRGLVMPLEVPVRATCRSCGGRGEIWTERCGECAGTGESVFPHRVRLALPAGVADGARFRFRISSPHATPVRVEVRVAIGPSA